MSNLDAILKTIASRVGAEHRISADVERMNGVLELAKLRERSGLTQSALAKRLEFSQPQVSAMEHSPADITLETLSAT